ncbi:MAG: cation:proton antiporter, partial [Clostridiales bacterium]
MLISLLQIFCAIGIAFLVGKLISKIKLPAILGWLLAGMLLGSHALNLINTTILNTMGYQTAIHILECVVGLMIGTELVWGKIKKSGAQIMITTLTQSLGTFILVTLVFGIIFYFTAIPLYLAAIFGGIALATAPAPALSIVNEFKTDGPVTRALIPMAALDDIVGVVIFFSVIAAVSATLAAQKLPPYMMILVVLFPLVIGIAIGLLDGMLLKRKSVKAATLTLMIGGLLLASGIGLAINILVLPQPLLNFMLIGMAFSATFANIVSRERLAQIMEYFQPLLGFAMIVVILNLGASLDYHLILGAGLFTTVYILTRAAGKY